MKCRPLILVLGLLTAATTLAAGPADEVTVTLATPGGEVTALFRPERQGPSRGGVVLLPDVETRTSFGPVVGTLHRGLPDSGWSTLAVPLADGATPADRLDATRPRIAAAIAHLKGSNILNVALVGHGFGALAAADYLANTPDTAVHGLVALGIRDQPGDPRQDAAALLARSPVPVLDLFGSRDRDDVVLNASRRAATARAALNPADAGAKGPRELPAYRQVVIEAATHDFAAHSSTLLRRVRGWLQRHAAGTRVATRPKENP